MNVLIGIIILLLIVAILVYVYLVVIDKRLCNEKDPWHTWLCKTLHGSVKCPIDHILSNDGTVCMKCPDGQGVKSVKEVINRSGDNDINCVINECDQGFVISSDKKQCLPCPTDVEGATNYVNEGERCIIESCVDGYTLTSNQDRCVLCPVDNNAVRYGIDETGERCVIESCADGYTLTSNQDKCVLCPDFPNASITRATTTVDGGYMCEIDSCADGYTLVEGECKVCPSDPNINKLVILGGQCFPVDCNHGYALNFDKQRCIECSEQLKNDPMIDTFGSSKLYFETRSDPEETCVIDTCKDYFRTIPSLDRTRCLTCPHYDDYRHTGERVNENDECVLTGCIGGYLLSLDKKECLECPTGVEGAIGVQEEINATTGEKECVIQGCGAGRLLTADKKDCLLCPSDTSNSFGVIEENGRCIIRECAGGYTLNADKTKCEVTPPPEATCPPADWDGLTPYFLYNNECIEGYQPQLKGLIHTITPTTFKLRITAATGPCNFQLISFSFFVYWDQNVCSLSNVKTGRQDAPWEVTNAIWLPAGSTTFLPPATTQTYSLSSQSYTTPSTLEQLVFREEIQPYASYRAICSVFDTNETTSPWNRPELPSYEFNKCKSGVYVAEFTFTIREEATPAFGSNEIVTVIHSIRSDSFVNQGTQDYKASVPYPRGDGYNNVSIIDVINMDHFNPSFVGRIKR